MQLGKSPKELQNKISISLPFGSLPPDMQHSFKKMIATLENEYGENGGYKTGVLSSKMSMATIRMTTKTDAGITCYDYNYSAPGEGGGFSTSDYEASIARRESDYNKKSRTGGMGAVYDPDKFDLTQKELNDLPALKRSISINVSNATCWQVLKLIHDKYKISVICRDPKETKQIANIHLNSVTLLEALRSLEKTYENTRWIWMRNSFLVIRSRDLNVIHGVSQPEGTLKLRP